MRDELGAWSCRQARIADSMTLRPGLPTTTTDKVGRESACQEQVRETPDKAVSQALTLRTISAQASRQLLGRRLGSGVVRYCR